MTQSQKRALDAVQNMIEVKTDEVFAHNIMILIFGILNVEHDMDKDTTIPISPNWGNDKLQVPDWIKTMSTPPFVPRDISHPEPCPFPPQVWYEQETEPIQPTARELRYATEVSCTGDKDGIVCVTNTADVRYTGDKNCITTTRNVSDCITYTGDFRDGQTSFNDK